MALSREEWLEQEREAEAAQQVRFDGLTRLTLRLQGYADRADASADALATIPGADARPRRQEAEDLRQALEIVEWMAGRLDRVHVLQQPVPYQGARFGRKREQRA